MASNEEGALFVENFHYGSIHTNLGPDRTLVHRIPTQSDQVWGTEFADIPRVNPLPAATSSDGDTAAGGLVIIRKDVVLEEDPSGPAPYRWRAQAPRVLEKIIPATWGVNSSGTAQATGTYAPDLRDSTGARVEYNAAAWVLDGTLHSLEFVQDATRSGFPGGAVPPFTITYWEYGGPTGGGGGGGGEANTASNQGGGDGLFKTKTGVDLEFRTLVGGTNITLVPGADTITIDAAGGAGGISGGANLGGGAQVFKQAVAGVMEFRTLVPGASVALAQGPDELEITAGVLTATQVAHGYAAGQPVYWDGAAWLLARADALTTIATHLVSAAPDANTLQLTNSGPFTLGGPHGFAPGAWVYTSSSAAGALTTVEPAPPAYSNPVALATTATELLAFPFRASLGGGGPTAGALASHLRGVEAAYAPAGGAGAAAPVSYGVAGSPAAAGFLIGTPRVARWSAFVPHGFGGGAVTASVRFAAPVGGVAFRAGAQPLKPGDTIGAFAPTYGPAAVGTGAGAATVAAVNLSVGGTAGLAPGEPFWFFLERATSDPGDAGAGTAAVHDLFLSF